MQLKNRVMDDRYRRSKGGRRGRGDSESRVLSERRPLFTEQLAPPNYDVPPQVLIDSFIEKEVRYAGVVGDVSKYVDATNRTEVLREIDRGKREKSVCWKTTYEDDAIFSISAHNVKISKRDGEEELLLRLAIHEIAAMSYIKDDDQHILCIKFVYEKNMERRDTDSNDSSKLAVLYCDSRGSAEELCSLLNHCFGFVYTNNTMRFLDDKVNEAAAGMSISSSTIRSESMSNSKPKAEGGTHENKTLGFLSQSTTDLVNNPSTLSSATSRSLPRRHSNSAQHGNNNNAQTSSDASTPEGSMQKNEILLQDYTRRLYNKLNIQELRQFAMLVKAWHTNMPFKEFCEQVLELYGPDRKHLIAGMRPFIPEKDVIYFEGFVEKLGLRGSLGNANSPVTGNGTLSNGAVNSKIIRTAVISPLSTASPAASASNSHSVGTGTGQPDDYDRMLSGFSSNIDNLATHVSSGETWNIAGGNT